MAGWTGRDADGQPMPTAHLDFLWALLTSGPFAAAWLASAWGYGWATMRWIVRWNEPQRSPGSLAIEVTAGVACALFLDLALAPLGVLQLAGGIGAWVTTVVGLALLIVRGAIEKQARPHGPSWWMTLGAVCAAPAMAVLLLAACSAPGWLWSTEFGGYDALSYHLQLPKEWLADGRMHGLTHNVYSFFPGAMEAAYYHLAAMQRDAVHAAYACQLLHAGVALLAAWAIGHTAHHFAGKIAGFCAFVAAIGTPWVIVTGSLAYNEMTTALMLAGALLVMHERAAAPTKRWALIGFLLGIACAAKLTSIGLVAAPVAIAALLARAQRPNWRAAVIGCVAFTIALLPYFARNFLETGNPLFPFATGLFGLGHFTAEQAHIWSAGHAGPGGVDAKLAALWSQFMRYGIGANPQPGEPWVPQWSMLPWLGAAGLIVAMARRRRSPIAWQMAALLFAQVAFWLFFTHLKSRFLLPTVVPCAIGAGLGAAALLQPLADRSPRRFGRANAAIGGVLAIAWCLVPVAIFAFEPRLNDAAPASRVGRIDYFTGSALSREQRAELAGVSHILAINLLPPDSLTLLIGEAAPFYLDRPVIYQTTWDRGPLSRILRDHPDDPAAWRAALKSLGLTHLFVNEDMLKRWEAAGWNDPLITAESARAFAEACGQREQVTPAGVLYAVR